MVATVAQHFASFKFFVIYQWIGTRPASAAGRLAFQLHVADCADRIPAVFFISGVGTMAEWEFAQTNPAQELAELRFFSVKKNQGDKTIEFRITVREFAPRNQLSMRFYAEADKQTNQKTAPYTASGWGPTLLRALSDCVREIERFPYEGD
jgi:hypothetical protein